MPRYGYFPGCSLAGSAKAYGLSTVAVFEALGIELVELRDWSCCGATSGHSTDRLRADALAARNLALTAEQGFQELVVPCAACFNRAKRAAALIAEGGPGKEKIEGLLGRRFADDVRVVHPLQVLASEAVAREIEARRQVDLSGLRVGAYYGCLLLRPPQEVGIDDPEDPSIMETILSACGTVPVTWYQRTECCGAGHSVAQPSVVRRLVHRIVENARSHGAEALAVACPMCHVNLETRQVPGPEGRGLPALYITQLVGLALGLDPVRLGLPREFRLPAGVSEVTS